MPRWTEADLAAAIARTSRSPSGSGTACLVPPPEPEPVACDEPLEPHEGAKAGPGRAFVSIESRRRRLIDPRANLYGGSKAIEDACVSAGLLNDDNEEESEGHVFQTKVGRDEPEETVVRIWWEDYSLQPNSSPT